MVNSLSRGMKQRLSLARALVHDPEVLILDEPAGGLDPRARVELRNLLVELRTMGKTIVISSPHPRRARGDVHRRRDHGGGPAAGLGHARARSATARAAAARCGCAWPAARSGSYTVADEAEQVALLRSLVDERQRRRRVQPRWATGSRTCS